VRAVCRYVSAAENYDTFVQQQAAEAVYTGAGSERRTSLCRVSTTQVWGDPGAMATAARIRSCGVPEIVVKNGAAEVAVSIDGQVQSSATPAASQIRDTTGAGDSFNAVYLTGRIVGMKPLQACELGREIAREVIGHFGALAPREALTAFSETVRHYA